MLMFELEAAEALAGLSRYSSVRGELERRPCQQILAESQDRGMDAQQFSGDTAATVTAPMNNTKNVEAAIGQTCSTSGQSKVCRTLKQNLTEAEKKARRLSRILANRESARRTIRRRQTMYLELTGNAANQLEENMFLKKEKELVMKKYNFLKDKNEFLKAEMAKRKMAEQGERREDQSNSFSTAASVTTPPFFVCNHPSFVPFFWYPVIASSDSFSSQYISNPDGTMPTCEKPCSDQGQKGTGGINANPGTPLFLLPVPWFPFLTQVGTPESHPGVERKNDASYTHQCGTCSSSVAHIQEDNHQLASNRNMTVDAFLTQVGTPESHPGVERKNDASYIHQCRTCSSSVAHIQEDNHQLATNRNMKMDAFRHGCLEKSGGQPLMSPSRKLKETMSAGEARTPSRKLKETMSAGEARIKRKELMKLKYRRGDNSHVQ